ncbi:DUF309 domain-containing protein [Marimonas sp. MJW-29]|uniref:DUF309 domain-containing protein n=1 Tax=Sulfitobacter sediminis TaxID=3234186 RepID=A0ABV3RIH4_9RHOB
MTHGILMPPHAYVPGQTARHAEDWFDAIKASVTEKTPVDALADTSAFRAGLAYLEAGYFWECHEVLEAVWMRTPPGTEEREMVQALIQLANARLKLRMDRPKAAMRLCDMVEEHVRRLPRDKAILGQHAAALAKAVEGVRGGIKR